MPDTLKEFVVNGDPADNERRALEQAQKEMRKE